jgi:hypothetical protein
MRRIDRCCIGGHMGRMNVRAFPGENLSLPPVVVKGPKRPFVCRGCGLSYTTSEMLALPKREIEGIAGRQPACGGCNTTEFVNTDEVGNRPHHSDPDYNIGSGEISPQERATFGFGCHPG